MNFAARLFLVFILVFGAGLGSLDIAAAQVDSKKLPAAKQAVTSLAERAKGSEKTGQVPSVTDPAVKKLFDVVFDVSDVMDVRNIPFDQLSPLSDRMSIGNQVGTIYMLSGTGYTDLSQVGNDNAVAEKVNMNVVRHPDEMGRYFDFVVAIQASIADGAQAFIAGAKPADVARPNVQSGIDKVRGGAARSLAGTLETLAVIGLTDDWIRARVLAIMVAAPKMKGFLLAEQKEALRKTAIAVADVTDDLVAKKALQDFARIITS